MTKSLMISIPPEQLVNILNSNVLLLLRKTVPKDFKGWVYIYCTKGKDILEYSFLGYRTLRESSFYNNGIGVALNCKVVARFWFDEYETYNHDNHGVGLYTDVAEYNVMYDDLDKLCLDYREIEHYGKGKDLYAWHIKKLEIFDKPLSLNDFYKKDYYATSDYYYIPVTNAPKRSVWVYTKEENNNVRIINSKY